MKRRLRRGGFERLERREMLSVTSIVNTGGSQFLVDTSEGLTCNYASFQITNDASADPDLWVKVDNFTGGVVGLAPNEDSIYHLGPLAANATGAVFFYLQATSATTVDQGYRISVYASDPSVGSPPIVLQQTFSYIDVIQTEQAADIKIFTVSYDTSTPILGGEINVTVTGNLGLLNATRDAVFTPACLPNWLADVFELTSSTITITSGANVRTDTNRLLLTGFSNQSGNPFTAQYTFRVTDVTNVSVAISPTQFVGKNENFKHHDLSATPVVPLEPVVNATTLEKLAVPLTLPEVGGLVEFTLRLSNTSASIVTLDKLLDTLPTLPANATYVAGSAKYNAVAIGDPAISGSLLTWSGLFPVPANGTSTLTFNAVIPGTLGSYVNSSIGRIGPVQIDTTLDVLDDSPATATVLVTKPLADLQIVKTDGTPTYTPGAPVTYTIAVTNLGPTAVAGAQVVDLFPAQVSTVTWTAAFTNGSGTASGSGNINQAITLGVGGTAIYTVTAATLPTATGTLVNTATVTAPSNRTDPNPANNTSTDTNLPVLQADLSVTKTDASATYVPGLGTVYTVVVRNNGPSFVTGATVVDTFAASFTGVAWTAVFAGAGSTGVGSGSGNINQVINLASGGTATYTITASISSTATVAITNTVTVAPPVGTLDPNLANNTATDTNTATPRVNLTIVKTDGSATYVPGLVTTYTVTVTNTGPSFLAGGTLVDVFPAAIVGATWTAVYTGTGSTGAAAGSGNINATFSLASGGTAVFTILAPVSATATGTLVNTATVNVPAGTTNTNPINFSTDTDTPAPIADLRVVKTDGTSQYVPGTSTTYVITVTNDGPSAVTGAVVADTFPALIGSATWTAVFTNGSGMASGAGNINQAITLGVGGSAVYTVVTNILPSAVGNLVNTVTVAAPAGTTDPNPANNTSTDINTLDPSVDLLAVKTDGSATYTPGATTVYTVTITNASSVAVTGAQVVDVFPAQVASATWTAVFTNGSGTTSGSGNINQTINLNPGGTVVYTIAAAILSTATGNLVNTVTVTPPAGVPDPNPANNTSTDIDLPAPQADLSVTKTDASATYVPGLGTVYTVVVRNNGPSFVTGATVVDTFAASFTGVAWTAVFAGAGSTGVGSGSGNINQVINLASGGTATYTITASISSTATVAITNTVTVAPPVGTLDPNLANNTATDTNTATPRVNLTIVKTDGSATYVPGLVTTYTVTVTNTGPSFLAGGTLVDVFPAAIVGATWTAVYTGTGSTGAAAGSGNINATFSLASGGTAVFTILAPVSATATGTLVNTATVNVPAGTTNTNPVTFSTDTDTPAPIADLSILKTDGSATYLPGQPTVYTVTVANIGPSAVIGARVVDVFSPLLGSVSWTAVFTNGSGTASGAGNINQLINLGSGGRAVYTIVANILVSASGNLVNTATVAAPAGTTDPNPTNNSATDVDVPAAPDNGLVTGTDDGCGSGPLVRVLDPATGLVRAQFFAYEAGFRGGVRVATADLNRDGFDEIITAPGRGRQGQVRVWTQAGVELGGYRTLPFGPGYAGGVEVVAGDVDGDGQADLVTSMSSATGTVSVFRVLPFAMDPVVDTPYRSFVPFPGSYTGGVNVAVADFGTFVNGVKTSPALDGRCEVVVGTNAGIAATVRVYDLSVTPKIVGTMRPIAPTFTGGVTLSIGRYDADAIPDILVGAGINGRSAVEIYSGTTFTQLARVNAFASFAKPNAKVYATSLDTTGDGILDRIYAVQGQQGTAGTNGVTVWTRIRGVTAQLPLTAGFLPPLRITNMTRRRPV